MSVLDGLRSVLLVHAHPDDETIATGALTLELVARGISVDLVTCTRGEQGEVRSAVGPLASGQLVELRCRELAGARRDLGIARHAWLGEAPARVAGAEPTRYHDSGMRWIEPGLAGPAERCSAAAFTAQPADDETADLTALLRAWSPDLVVSYADDGGYGHPDHIRAQQIARAACAETGIAFAAFLPEPERGVEWIDASRHAPALRRALGNYASQLEVRDDGITHVGGQDEPLHLGGGLRRT